MRRRGFIKVIAGAAVAWPLAARAQPSAMPVVGFVRGGNADGAMHLVEALRRGLGEMGFVEGQNLAIEYRWADGQNHRLPELIADLLRRRVAVVVASATPAAVAAKAATKTTPIIFVVQGDPVDFGLVDSIARPGGNATGISFLTSVLAGKRLELLHHLVPTAASIAVLVNPINPATEAFVQEVQVAARKLGVQSHVLTASNDRDIDIAFESLLRVGANALIVGGDALFTGRRVQLAILAARHSIPAIYTSRQFPEAGGLMSYGADLLDEHRLAGVYAGRILKGAKPVDLPVQLPTRFHMVINLRTARALGLSVPLTLQVAADEVIE
jgi:putative ABC transport system substrate-binding protein